MSNERVRVTYRIETPLEPESAAEAIAGEQSTGTFVAVPGETLDLRERHRACVERVTPLETVEVASLPGSRSPDGGAPYHRAEVVVSFPLDNMGTNLPTLLSTVAGNLFELRELSGLRLLDIDFPPAFGQAYPGPRFGIEGTRRLAGVFDRPLIGTIIKPSVGLSPNATAELVAGLVDAGIDFIKDDELQADSPHSPFDARVEAVMRVVNVAADRLGKKAMIAFNVTDELDAMLEHVETVQRAGGTGVMVSLNSVGLVGVSHLRRHCDLPIHGHRNGWGMWTRHPMLGMEFTVYQKLWRLVGIDQLHVNALGNKFWEPDDSVVHSIRACLTPMFRDDDRAMPVVSSGQWGGQAPDTYARVQTVDLMYLAGGGIMAHPGGPAAGVRAIRGAWEAAVSGIPLDDYARNHPDLAASIVKFGGAGR